MAKVIVELTEIEALVKTIDSGHGSSTEHVDVHKLRAYLASCPMVQDPDDEI